MYQNNSEEAVKRAKKTIAFYISVGKIYREFLKKNGFEKDTNNIFEEFKKSGFKSNHKLVIPDSMIKFTMHSRNTRMNLKVQLQKFRDAGIDLPIIQFNPIGDAIESFSLLKKTYFWMNNYV